MSSSGATSQRTPAWKRLGLKLKPAASEAGPAPVGQPASQSNKRRLDAPQAADPAAAGAKKPRHYEDNNAAYTPDGALRKKKSVSFGDTPSKNSATTTPSTIVKNGKLVTKKPKGPPKKQTPANINLQPALEYLREWKSSRDTWKFNKNHQTLLIRHVFDSEHVPSTDIDTLYDYLQDLKGFVRTRLKETAMEVRQKDQAAGSAGWPEGLADIMEKQAAYDRVLSELLNLRRSGTKRRAFHEADFVNTNKYDKFVTQRAVKRMRAEMILDEMSESDDTDKSTTTATATEDEATKASSASGVPAVKSETAGKRRRKLRVNVDDDDSSSSDESSSEEEDDSDDESSSDGSSSSSSSDDSDSDEEGGVGADGDHRMGGQTQDGYETSSSSSSSSSSSDDDSDSD